jgi:adenylosuccinate synthase
VDVLAIMKGDVLDHKEQIPIAIGVDAKGDPIYQRFAGWQQPTKGMKSYKDLPAEAQTFYATAAHRIGAKLGYIGTGPENDDLITVMKGPQDL